MSITVGAGWSIGPGFTAVANPAINGFTVPAVLAGTSVTDTVTGVAVNKSGLYVSVGSWAGNSIATYSTSSNGSTWTTPALMGSAVATSGYLRAITVNSSGLFVGVGYASPAGGSYPTYATSANGSTWTTPAAMNSYTSNAMLMTNIVWSAALNLFVAMGYTLNASYYQPVSAWSADGTTWTTPAAMGGATGTTGYYQGLAVNDTGLCVATGYDPSWRPIYSTSSDGKTWSAPAFMNGYAGRAAMRSVTWNRMLGVFAAVGGTEDTSSISTPVYATSANGSTWTTPTTISGTSNYQWCSMLNVVTDPNSGLMVSVATLGNSGYSGSPPCYSTSTSGSNWTAPSFYSNYNPNLGYPMIPLTSYNGLFVSLGSNASSLPVYSTSF